MSIHSVMPQTTKLYVRVFQLTLVTLLFSAQGYNMNVKLTAIVEGISYVSILNAKILMSVCKAEDHVH